MPTGRQSVSRRRPPASALGDQQDGYSKEQKTGHYSVSLADVDGRTLAFPSFNGMPAPEQVWDLVGKGGPSATMNGNVMTIDPKTLR